MTQLFRKRGFAVFSAGLRVMTCVALAASVSAAAHAASYAPGQDSMVLAPNLDFDAVLFSLEAVDEVFAAREVEGVPLRLRIPAQSGEIELALAPNRRLLAPDARVFREGRWMTPEQAGIKIPYIGQVVGDASSWVRISDHGGRYSGIVFTNGELFELRPDPAGPSGYRFGAVEASEFLGENSPLAATCGVEHAASAIAPAGSSAASSERRADCKAIDIAALSDHTHVSKLGSEQASQDEVVARMNEIDALYKADINMGFHVKEVMSFPDSSTPEFNPASSTTPLDELFSWKGKNLPERGLVHLFVARTTSGVVGLAYVGTTCQGNYATGVSNYLGNNSMSMIVAAHEIGHNFGSDHDTGNQGFIMHPSVVPDATQFSPASKSMIAASAGTAKCFVACDSGDDDDDDETTSGEDSSTEDPTSSGDDDDDDTSSTEQDTSTEDPSSGGDDDDDDDDDDTSTPSDDDDDDDDDDSSATESSDDDDDDDDSTDTADDDDDDDDDSSASSEDSDDDDDDSASGNDNGADDERGDRGCALAPKSGGSAAALFIGASAFFARRRKRA